MFFIETRIFWPVGNLLRYAPSGMAARPPRRRKEITMGIVAIVAFVLIAFLWLSISLFGMESQIDQDAGSCALLAGIWLQQSSTALARCRIELILAPNGRYTEKLSVRIPMATEGREANATDIGGTHRGSWKREGTLVSLSGDDNWPAHQRDLRFFHRLR
jgi:hypothetical protein